jgi:hypothetical protein
MATLLLLALFFATAPGSTLESAASAMHRLLRDSTEIPFQVRSTVEFYEPSGRLRDSRRSEHHFQIVAIKHSDQGVTYRFVLKKLSKHISDELANTDATVIMTVVAFSSAAAGGLYQLSTAPSRLTVTYNATSNCASFALHKGKFRLNEWCGSGEASFDPEPLVPRHVNFAAAGLPLAGPKDSLRAYRAELDFQLVSVPGDARPLLLPQRIVATYESDRGRTVVQSDYTPARR